MRRSFSLSSLTFLVSLAIAGISTPSAAADQVRLKSSNEVGGLRRIGASMEVGGHLLVQVEGKEQRLPMHVKALLRHQERLLAAENGLHSVRYYDDIQVELNVDGKSMEPKLREDRRLVTVTVAGEKSTMTGLYGPLFREELDLLQLPADSLVLDRLLPGDDEFRSVDATWKPDADSMALLLGLDAVGSTDVESKLFKLTDEMAKIEMTGTVHGAVDGIATQIDLRGRYYFDRESETISGLEIHIKEKRAISHTAPGVDVTARLKMHVTPLAAAPMLDDEQLEGLSLEPRVEHEPLEYMAGDGGIRFMHDRRWHVTQELGRRLTMRLVDDGELIAQCNLVEQKPMKEGSRVSLDKFQSDIKTVLGDKFGAFRRAKESMDSADNVVYEVQAEGLVADMPIQWIYYLISGQDGRRISLVFTMEGQLVEKFAHLDAGIIASLELLERSEESPTAIDVSKSNDALKSSDAAKSAVASEADGQGEADEEPVSLLNPKADRSADASSDDGPALR